MTTEIVLSSPSSSSDSIAFAQGTGEVFIGSTVSTGVYKGTGSGGFTKLPLTGVVPYVNFGKGISTSFDGNTLSVISDTNLYVYVREGSSTYTLKFQWTSPSTLDDVSLSGDGGTLAVGSSINNSSAGVVWVFLKQSDSTWALSKTINSPNVPGKFGKSISLDYIGATLIVGEPDGEGGNQVVVETAVDADDNSIVVEINPDGDGGFEDSCHSDGGIGSTSNASVVNLQGEVRYLAKAVLGTDGIFRYALFQGGGGEATQVWLDKTYVQDIGYLYGSDATTYTGNITGQGSCGIYDQWEWDVGVTPSDLGWEDGTPIEIKPTTARVCVPKKKDLYQNPCNLFDYGGDFGIFKVGSGLYVRPKMTQTIMYMIHITVDMSTGISTYELVEFHNTLENAWNSACQLSETEIVLFGTRPNHADVPVAQRNKKMYAIYNTGSRTFGDWNPIHDGSGQVGELSILTTGCWAHGGYIYCLQRHDWWVGYSKLSIWLSKLDVAGNVVSMTELSNRDVINPYNVSVNYVSVETGCVLLEYNMAYSTTHSHPRKYATVPIGGGTLSPFVDFNYGTWNTSPLSVAYHETRSQHYGAVYVMKEAYAGSYQNVTESLMFLECSITTSGFAFNEADLFYPDAYGTYPEYPRMDHIFKLHYDATLDRLYLLYTNHHEAADALTVIVNIDERTLTPEYIAIGRDTENINEGWYDNGVFSTTIYTFGAAICMSHKKYVFRDGDYLVFSGQYGQNTAGSYTLMRWKPPQNIPVRDIIQSFNPHSYVPCEGNRINVQPSYVELHTYGPLTRTTWHQLKEFGYHYTQYEKWDLTHNSVFGDGYTYPFNDKEGVQMLLIYSDYYSDYRVGNPTDRPIFTDTTCFSLFKVTGIQQTLIYIGNKYNFAALPWLSVRVNAAGTIDFYNRSVLAVSTSIPVPEGEPFMITVIRRSANIIELYLNDALIASQDFGAQDTSHMGKVIGCAGDRTEPIQGGFGHSAFFVHDLPTTALTTIYQALINNQSCYGFSNSDLYIPGTDGYVTSNGPESLAYNKPYSLCFVVPDNAATYIVWSFEGIDSTLLVGGQPFKYQLYLKVEGGKLYRNNSLITSGIQSGDHITLTFDGATSALYKNGNYLGVGYNITSVGHDVDLSSYTQMINGWAWAGGTPTPTGNVTNFRYYKRSLTSTEVPLVYGEIV